MADWKNILANIGVPGYGSIPRMIMDQIQRKQMNPDRGFQELPPQGPWEQLRPELFGLMGQMGYPQQSGLNPMIMQILPLLLGGLRKKG